MSRIADLAVLEAAAFQEGDVHERHASGTIAEYEQVAGKGKRRSFREFHSVQLHEDRLGDGPFPRFVNTGVDIRERVGLYDQFLADRLVVYRTKDTHVERDGVPYHALPDKEGVVFCDKSLGNGGKRESVSLDESGDAPSHFFIIDGGPEAV